MSAEGVAKTTHDIRGRASADRLLFFVDQALRAAGTAPAPARAVAEALVEASLRGVDSHGVRLLVHYAKVAQTGRINPNPTIKVERTGPATAIVDADNCFGHYASFAAVDEALALARETGVAAVSVINSSHFGAAGCYSMRAANAGMVGFAFANSDSFVLPHDGIEPFHGTNPISFAAPVAGSRPFLLDMATSTVPWNRVQDLMAKGLQLPNDVAVDGEGAITRRPADARALLPIGGQSFGFKGAALAGTLEVLSAVMTGMPHCKQLLGMVGSDWSTPRHLGHFFIVIDPTRFIPRPLYDAAMAAYLADLRAMPAKPGATVMAPGDREWKVEQERSTQGIPVAEALAVAFEELAAGLSIAPPDYL